MARNKNEAINGAFLARTMRTAGEYSIISLSWSIFIGNTLAAFLSSESEHDRSDAIAKNYFIRHRQLKEHVELFFKEKANRVKFLKNIDFYINKLVEIGFLKIKEDAETVDNRLYQVKRILKAKISFAQLEEFKQRLENYVESF
jgi:hypothetical protein